MVGQHRNEYDGNYISTIKKKKTVSGNKSKYEVQCSIYFTSFKNIPYFLKPFILYYGGKYDSNAVCGSLNRNAFIYELIDKYGFTFGSKQDRNIILKNVIKHHNECFDCTVKGMQA